jgi:ribosomal protein S18 acetylase RimI-like enzyme
MIDGAFLARIRMEALDRAKHDRKHFTCGDDRLDNFLKHTAGRQQKEDLTRVSVSCLDETVVVIGYYALNNHSIDASTLPASDRKTLPNYESIPAIYLSKVGVQREFQGRGLGQHLVAHAFKRCIEIADLSGAYFVVLDALNEDAARLYRRLGFFDLPGHKERMLIKMSVVRTAAGPSSTSASAPTPAGRT